MPAAPFPPSVQDVDQGTADTSPPGRSSSLGLFLEAPVAVSSERPPISLGPGIDEHPSESNRQFVSAPTGQILGVVPAPQPADSPAPIELRLEEPADDDVDDVSAENHYERAVQSFDSGDQQRARRHAEESVRLNADHPDALQLRDRIAEALRQQSRDRIRIRESPRADGTDLPTIKSGAQGIASVEILPPPGD